MSGLISGSAGFSYTYGFNVGTGVNREDLLDLVANIDPWDAPHLTLAPKTKAYHVLHEWPEDTLPAIDTSGAIEGSDFVADSVTIPVRMNNNTMIFRRDVIVTNTQLAVNPAGIADMYKYQTTQSIKAIKRNIESRTFSNPGVSATGATNAGRVMRNLADMITTNKWHAGDPVIGGGGLGAPGDLDEDVYNNVLQVVYEAGGNPMDVYCSPVTKRTISTFTGNSSAQGMIIANADRTAINSIDIYVSDYGVNYIHLDRWVPKQTETSADSLVNGADCNADVGRLFWIDRTRSRIAYLRTPKHVPIASGGDSVRGMVLTELTLELVNEKGHARLWSIDN